MSLEDYKKSFPYICDACGEFTHTSAEYCENYGKQGFLREAKNIDYEEKVIYKKTSIISKEETKKCLIYSIVGIIVPLLFLVVGLNFPYPTSIGIYFILYSITWMPIGIISLIFYFINPEISYGMMMGKKKVKKINTRNVIIGRRITLIIINLGLILSILVFIILMNTLLSLV